MSGSVDFLSADWLVQRLALLGPLDVGDGVPDRLRVTNTVGGAPGGDVTWIDTYEGGHLVGSALGGGDADVVLTTPYEQALRILRGELGENSAFIQGLTKTGGVTGPLLGLLAHRRSEPYQVARAELLAVTQVP